MIFNCKKEKNNNNQISFFIIDSEKIFNNASNDGSKYFKHFHLLLKKIAVKCCFCTVSINLR